MRESSAKRLERRTGRKVAEWNRRIRRRFRTQASLRQWLTDEGVTGYARQLLVWERFGYPSFWLKRAYDENA